MSIVEKDEDKDKASCCRLFILMSTEVLGGYCCEGGFCHEHPSCLCPEVRIVVYHAAKREADPMQKRQRLRTAEMWLDKLDELDENLPAEIVEQETLTRKILQEALALATEDL